jgi:drug/metabolite transporter (DMT)-like permease
MVLVFPVALAIAVAILWRSRREPGSQGTGCRWFWAWSLVGAALSFSFLTGFSIGLFVLPLALLLLGIVLRRSPRWPESVGFFEGVGMVLLAVAFLNRGYQGANPHPWLYAGVLIVALAGAVYAVARRNA